MSKVLRNKIPTTYLPDNWRSIGAEVFHCSENKIERVVYGMTANIGIFEYFLNLAEKGKEAYEAKQLEIAQRVKALQA